MTITTKGGGAKVWPSRTTCRCLRSGSPRIRRNAPRAGSFAPGQSSANIGPELIPHVPDEPAEKSIADPAHVLRRVVELEGSQVFATTLLPSPPHSAPRPESTDRCGDGRQTPFSPRIRFAPRCGAARGKIPWVFAPCRAQPGLDRILKSSFAIRASRTVCRNPTSSRPTRMEHSMRYSRRRGRLRWRCWWHRGSVNGPLQSLASGGWNVEQKMAQPCRLVPLLRHRLGERLRGCQSEAQCEKCTREAAAANADVRCHMSTPADRCDSDQQHGT